MPSPLNRQVWPGSGHMFIRRGSRFCSKLDRTRGRRRRLSIQAGRQCPNTNRWNKPPRPQGWESGVSRLKIRAFLENSLEIRRHFSGLCKLLSPAVLCQQQHRQSRDKHHSIYNRQDITVRRTEHDSEHRPPPLDANFVSQVAFDKCGQAASRPRSIRCAHRGSLTAVSAHSGDDRFCRAANGSSRRRGRNAHSNSAVVTVRGQFLRSPSTQRTTEFRADGRKSAAGDLPSNDMSAKAPGPFPVKGQARPGPFVVR